MSHIRERLPGVWVAGSVLTAEELEALDREPIPRYSELRVGDQVVGEVTDVQIQPTVRITATNKTGPIFDGLIKASGRAWIRCAPLRIAIDECRHCGAPSPGSKCRYCNTTRGPLAVMETPAVVDPLPTATVCKHGLPACVRCGHATRDSVHTTRAGMGAVARIKR